MSTVLLRSGRLFAVRRSALVQTRRLLDTIESGGSTTEPVDDLTVSSAPEIAIDEHRKVRQHRMIGHAIESYMNQIKGQQRALEKEKVAYELGKRHLANIMGLDPNAITQDDIDRAIEYLLPSALFDKRARPLMRPPEEVLPAIRVAKFDHEGRPRDSLFYTFRPNFNRLLSTAMLKQYEQDQIRMGIVTADLDPSSRLMTSGSTWVGCDVFTKRLRETISDEMYAQLILAFECLASLTYAHMEREFIMNYRQSLTGGTSRLFGPRIPDVSIDAEKRRRYAKSVGYAKCTRAVATVYDAGSGQYRVNGRTIDDFRSLLAREILLAPFVVLNQYGRFDVTVETKGYGGMIAIPRAVRHAVSLCVAALVDDDQKEKLRLAGLLTRDPRKRERSKINQPGARAKWKWRKR